MGNRLVDIITSADASLRDQSLHGVCSKATLAELLEHAEVLDGFWRGHTNLYERVRAQFFLYAIYRFYLPTREDLPATGRIPYAGYRCLLNRRFEEAINTFRTAQREEGPSDALASALAAAYHSLGFQTLSNQVRRSVRSFRGNQWMSRMGHPVDHPLRIRKELVQAESPSAPYPVLHEQTPVRMDLTHSAWSDIFFLGMDFPQGAKVLNISVNLGVRGRDDGTRPPVNAYLRVIDEPILRLASIDLGAAADISKLSDVFDYAKDYLGLLKAAIIASGIIPIGMESSGQSLGDLLAEVVGPGKGLELVSQVNDIPKGSRLAVSTTLLGALICICMRATAQTVSLTGPLQEGERRLVAARAILGEWLAGSGGGWQDSGGLWPGIKLIEGAPACEGDPEHGISRGRLLPSHRILGEEDASATMRQRLQDSLVMVHGGLAQDVGPILEMVTEKYLLRSEAEWKGRQDAIDVLDQILDALKEEDVRRIGELTTHNFFEPIQAIIPWASNYYTETLIDLMRDKFGEDFWGFWMLGGMSGGGMGFMFNPSVRDQAQEVLQATMLETKNRYQHALPFAMDPVVYNFAINEEGTVANLLADQRALLPPAYYAMMVPRWVRIDPRELTSARRIELSAFGAACRKQPEFSDMVETLFDRMFPEEHKGGSDVHGLTQLLRDNGFDEEQQEAIRSDLQSGRLGLAQNRLPQRTRIEDVKPEDVFDATGAIDPAFRERGSKAIANGEVAVVTLAAGTGSRWTHGAGVVKALNPFCRLGGKHRSFIEVHLAKSRKISRAHGADIPHLFTTSYLTHDPIAHTLADRDQYGYQGPLYLSPGRVVGIRMVPMVRDLRFMWEEMPQQILDSQAQKMAESLHAALIGWAEDAGEGTDYTDNLALQCLHPVGHWFEIPNLLRNGVLADLLDERPQLTTLLLHNIDTVGANVDPGLLGKHLDTGKCLTFEVISRRIDDLGGGLASLDGKTRLIEGLALPDEKIEFNLSYYNSMTTWIDIDQLLNVFGLARGDLRDEAKIGAAIRNLGSRLPTYITLKDVKKRWGHGQEDVFPVSQYEKLWSDMTGLSDVDCGFAVVPRARGQQLKDSAQLDGWVRDGSAAYAEALCDFDG